MKQQLRRQARVARQALTAHEKQLKSMQIQQRILPLLSNSNHVFLYRSYPQEVQTSWLFQHLEQQIFAPITHPDASMTWRCVEPDTIWKKGRFSILEPSHGELWTPNSEATTLICPLVAFDRQGHRLGQGMGCYDRWLSRYGSCVQQVIAFAFACQEVEAIVHETHDYPIDLIITEHEIIKATL